MSDKKGIRRRRRLIVVTKDNAFFHYLYRRQAMFKFQNR